MHFEGGVLASRPQCHRHAAERLTEANASPLEADVAVLIGFTHAIIGAVFDGRQTLGKGAATRSVAIARGRQAESLVRPYVIVQQSLRTPTEPSFENCCTSGISGLVSGSAFMRRSRGREALFFAVAWDRWLEVPAWMFDQSA